MTQEWGYSKSNGPATWFKKYPTAAGQRQSPIDFKSSGQAQRKPLPQLLWKYVPEDTKTVVNTGCGWKVAVDGTNSELSGGPLEGKYTIEQFHCHWGENDDTGSEHTVDGKAFAAEIHLVHRNSTKYSSMEEAVRQPDGLCVLGIFITPGKHNSELDKIISKLSSIPFKTDNITFSEPVDPGSFIPKSEEYWSYEGSLTTPPCMECVIWIVFKEPIQVSPDQLSMFRSTMSRCIRKYCKCKTHSCNICKNYRPTVPVGERVVTEYSK